MLNSEAIEYVKKPTEEFIRDSWRLVKRCTKPDRQGARMQSRGASTPAEAEAIQRSSQQAGRLTASSQRAANEQPATAGHRLLRRQQHTGQLSPRLPCMGAAATTSSVLPAQQQSADWSTEAPSLCGCLSSLRLSRACRRVLEDCTGDYDWLRDHGLHRLFREADLYPDQQHRMLRTIAAHAACIAWRACCRLTHFVSHPCVRRLLACHKSVALLRGWSWRC